MQHIIIRKMDYVKALSMVIDLNDPTTLQHAKRMHELGNKQFKTINEITTYLHYWECISSYFAIDHPHGRDEPHIFFQSPIESWNFLLLDNPPEQQLLSSNCYWHEIIQYTGVLAQQIVTNFLIQFQIRERIDQVFKKELLPTLVIDFEQEANVINTESLAIFGALRYCQYVRRIGFGFLDYQLCLNQITSTMNKFDLRSAYLTILRLWLMGYYKYMNKNYESTVNIMQAMIRLINTNKLENNTSISTLSKHGLILQQLAQAHANKANKLETALGFFNMAIYGNSENEQEYDITAKILLTSEEQEFLHKNHTILKLTPCRKEILLSAASWPQPNETHIASVLRCSYYTWRCKPCFKFLYYNIPEPTIKALEIINPTISPFKPGNNNNNNNNNNDDRPTQADIPSLLVDDHIHLKAGNSGPVLAVNTTAALAVNTTAASDVALPLLRPGETLGLQAMTRERVATPMVTLEPIIEAAEMDELGMAAAVRTLPIKEDVDEKTGEVIGDSRMSILIN